MHGAAPFKVGLCNGMKFDMIKQAHLLVMLIDCLLRKQGEHFDDDEGYEVDDDAGNDGEYY